MARITVEDCLKVENNRFALVRLAARRAKLILSGAPVVSENKSNRAIVSALREVASGQVRFLDPSEIETQDSSEESKQ